MATLAFDQPSVSQQPAHASTGTRRLDNVQVLRALAAGMIVLLHTQFMVSLEAGNRHLAYSQIEAFPLGAGVDLFFVISGFIIVFASEKLFGTDHRLEFIRRRILRIVPLFWLALSLRLAVLAIGAAAGQKAFPAVTTILSSFFFIPCDGMGYGPDFPFPILDLGWSLNYEMLFYVLVAGLIGLSRDKAVTGLVALLAGAAILATLAPPAGMAVRFWTHPITLEFAFGAMLAVAYRRGVRLAAPYQLALAAAGIAWWLLLPLTLVEHSGAPNSYSWMRVATSGIGAALLVAAATLGEVRASGRVTRAAVRLGDSSYSLYLVHPFVLLVLTQVLKRMPLFAAALWPATIAVLAAAIVAAHALHVHVERPVIRFLQALTDPQRPSRRLMVDA